MTEIVKKVCICGDPSVGKTSLVKRFITGKYDEKYISTLGTVISKKCVKGPGSDKNVTMMMWDISGQHEFQRIHAAAFKNATAGIMVCDVTRPETISHLTEWITDFREYAGPDTPVSVLVNKADLAVQNKEAIKSIRNSLDRLGLPIYLTSAKTGDNVEKAFTEMAREILKHNKANDEIIQNHTNGVPEQFESPQILLDYIMMRFCESLGDHEMGMHIIRKQISDMKVNFQAITKQQASQLVTNLTPIIREFKGEEIASHMKFELKKACDRCIG